MITLPSNVELQDLDVFREWKRSYEREELIRRLRKRADEHVQEYAQDQDWYKFAGGRQDRADAMLLREAANALERR